MALKYEEQELVNVARIRFLEKVLFVSGNSITGRLHIYAQCFYYKMYDGTELSYNIVRGQCVVAYCVRFKPAIMYAY